jgi:hypothetical protein
VRPRVGVLQHTLGGYVLFKPLSKRGHEEGFEVLEAEEGAGWDLACQVRLIGKRCPAFFVLRRHLAHQEGCLG